MNHKFSINLFNGHKECKIDFMLFLDYLDMSETKPKFKPIFNRFVFNGNEYIKIIPRSYITIDITSKMDKQEQLTYNPNSFCALNVQEMFYFKENLKSLIACYMDPSIPLYKLNEERELLVNTELAQKYIKTTRVSSNKMIKLVPAVVTQELVQYEGCALYINSMDNITYLTISEMCFMLDQLNKIDYTNLTLQCIQLYHILDNKSIEKLELPKKEPVSEVTESEVVDNKPKIKIDMPNELADII